MYGNICKCWDLNKTPNHWCTPVSRGIGHSSVYTVNEFGMSWTGLFAYATTSSIDLASHLKGSKVCPVPTIISFRGMQSKIITSEDTRPNTKLGAVERAELFETQLYYRHRNQNRLRNSREFLHEAEDGSKTNRLRTIVSWVSDGNHFAYMISMPLWKKCYYLF